MHKGVVRAFLRWWSALTLSTAWKNTWLGNWESSGRENREIWVHKIIFGNWESSRRENREIWVHKTIFGVCTALYLGTYRVCRKLQACGSTLNPNDCLSVLVKG